MQKLKPPVQKRQIVFQTKPTIFSGQELIDTMLDVFEGIIIDEERIKSYNTSIWRNEDEYTEEVD